MDNITSIIDKLRKEKNGANVHTINKACFYLKYFSKPDPYGDNNVTYREMMFSKIMNEANEYFKTKDISKLRDILRSLF